LIILDTETTGLLKPILSEAHQQPFITEMYCCKLDDNDFSFVGEFNHLIRPPIPIPEIITKITGIDDEMLEGKPTFVQVYDELCDFFLGETIVVAHNSSFDIGMIYWELFRLDKEKNFPWPKHHICTVEKSMALEKKRLKLRDLHKYARGRIHEEGAHRAKEDVMALVRSFLWLVKEGEIDMKDYK